MCVCKCGVKLKDSKSFGIKSKKIFKLRENNVITKKLRGLKCNFIN